MGSRDRDPEERGLRGAGPHRTRERPPGNALFITVKGETGALS